MNCSGSDVPDSEQPVSRPEGHGHLLQQLGRDLTGKLHQIGGWLRGSGRLLGDRGAPLP
jgi:hypothetical protein